MSKQPPLFIDMKDMEARRWLINLIDREGMGNAKVGGPRWNTDARSGERKNITYEFMDESKDQDSEKSDFEKKNYTEETNTSGKYWFRKDDDEKIGKKYHFSEHPMFDKHGCNTCPNSGNNHSEPSAMCLRNSRPRKSRPKGRLAGIPYWQVEGKKRPPPEGKEGKGGRRKKTKKRRTRKRKQTRRRRRKRK